MHCSNCNTDSDIYLWMYHADRCPHCKNPLMDAQNFLPPTREIFTVGDHYELPVRNEVSLLTLHTFVFRIQVIAYHDEHTRRVTFRLINGAITEPVFEAIFQAHKVENWKVGQELRFNLEAST